MSQPNQGPSAVLGGIPTVIPDIPVCGALMLIYGALAVINATTFRINRGKNHMFLPSALLGGFCFMRLGTLILRIVWSTRQDNVGLTIVAQILVNAGILIVYIINLILAQRILRAKQPRIGWNPVLRMSYRVFYAALAGSLVMVITSIVLSVKTTNPHTLSICRDIQLAALTNLLCFTCLPIIHIAVVVLLPKSRFEESFGQGSMTSKVIIVTLSTGLCMLMAGFKGGVAWSPPRPATDPPWYDSKVCFYIFSFAIEIVVLCLLTFSRIDQRFYVPDGAKRPGDYTRLQNQERLISKELNLKAEPKAAEADFEHDPAYMEPVYMLPPYRSVEHLDETIFEQVLSRMEAEDFENAPAYLEPAYLEPVYRLPPYHSYEHLDETMFTPILNQPF